jgi:hypothetical protein
MWQHYSSNLWYNAGEEIFDWTRRRKGLQTMILAKSLAETQRTHLVHPDGRETWVSRFFTASVDTPEQPVAFLVEKKAHAIVPPHFHEVNQFQVIAEGHGTLGKSQVRPFTLHYTNGYTGYGPIQAAEDGIAFFTLRNRFDPGAKYFPAGRSFMKPAPKRHRVSDHLLPSDAAALQSRRHERLETVFEPEADGLAAWFLRMGPDSRTQTPDSGQGGGQYVIVAAGSLLHDGVVLPRLSCLYVSSEAGPLTLQAGPDGLEVLTVQFPVAEAYPPRN